jgi:hypothetical protein
MIRVRPCLAAVAMSLALSGAAAAQADRAKMAQAAADADLAAFAAQLEGRYDNELQVFFARDLAIPDAERAPRAQLVIRRLANPVLGPQAFLAETRTGGATARRVLQLSADGVAGVVRMDVRALRITAGADAAALTSADLDPACRIDWRRDAGQFRGLPRDPRCALVAAPGPVRLSDDALWTPGAKPDGDLRLKRVRAFECWVAVLRGARHGDSGEGLNDWLFIRNVLLHDQGGEAVVRTDETPARTLRLKLRRVEWPTGTNRPSLTLYVHEGDAARAASYAWGEVDAERLGINLRWMQASCTHAPEKVFALE